MASSSDRTGSYGMVYETDSPWTELKRETLDLKAGKKQNENLKKRMDNTEEEIMGNSKKKKKRMKRGGKVERLVKKGCTIGEAMYKGLHPVITDSVRELAPDILRAELLLAFYVNNVTGVAPARTQDKAAAVADEVERLVRANKFEYRRMEGELNESIINSHYPAFGLPYHAIRLASFISPWTCSKIVGLFEEVQKTKAYKFKPESKRHGGAIHDSEAAPFHFGIVRRRGNGTRYTKDAIQSTLGNVNNASRKEQVAREAVWELMLFLQESVFSKLKKWVGRRGIVEGEEEIVRWRKLESGLKDGVRMAQEACSVPEDKEVIDYHYLVSSVAIGYAEAGVAHLDINDGNGYSFIFQVGGPAGYTRVPQLGVDIAHRTGDVVMLPTSQLVHHASPIWKDGGSESGRVVGVGYICCHVVNDFIRRHGR